MTFIKVLKEKKLGFDQFKNDKCLLKRINEYGFCAMGIYVDDCIMIGDERAIKKVIEDIKTKFDVTTEDVHEFIGCSIQKKKNEIWLHQLDLIKKMMKMFETDLLNMGDYETPAAGSFKVVRPTTEEEKLDDEGQHKYRSGVGSLLYLLKHSRPDLS